MMQKPFKLPDIGEGTAEAELVAWHVEVGDVVEEDQRLCDVMTDKATVEVTAPFAGTVKTRTGAPGDMLPVGGVILTFAIDDSSGAAASGPELQPDPAADTVSPKGQERATGHQSGQKSSTGIRVLASPALRKRVADLGINLADIVGSGPRGRVRQADVEAFLAYSAAPRLRSPSTTAPLPAATQALPNATGDYDEVPVIGLRRRISERMQDTKRRIAHFSYVEEIDVTQLEILRERLNRDRIEGRPKLTVLPFLVRALTRTLPEFPQLNALYDDAGGVVRRYGAIHAGIATQTPQGLVVTVLRDAARHDVWSAASEIARLSAQAKAGRAAAGDLVGSTITITSLGRMGGIATTPVINSPEVAIVGVNKVVERPIVQDGQIRIAKMMNLSSSFDHRVVDGWDAASFVQRLKALLEVPALLFVDA